MVKATDSRLTLDLASFAQTRLEYPTARCALVQRDVRSVLVIVRQILTSNPLEVLFVQRDDVIHQLAANSADPAFSDSVLPWAPQTRLDRFNATRLRNARTSLPNFASRSNRT